MPTQLFPTSNLKPGDVVNVTGPFQGLFQGQVRVKFTGAPWQAPSMQGPFSASVRVPDGAETGECAVEINGQRVYGTQCSIVGPGNAKPASGPYPEAWQNFGDKGSSMGSYVKQTQSRGVGAIAAHDLGAVPFSSPIRRYGALPVRPVEPPPPPAPKTAMSSRTVSQLIARTPGKAPTPFTPGKTGVPLVTPSRPLVTTVKTPTGTRQVTVISHPPVTVPGGVMTGPPPPGARATSIVGAQYAREAAADEMLEEEVVAEQITTPSVPAKSNLPLLIGGGLAAAVLLYFMTRSR